MNTYAHHNTGGRVAPGLIMVVPAFNHAGIVRMGKQMTKVITARACLLHPIRRYYLLAVVKTVIAQQLTKARKIARASTHTSAHVRKAGAVDNHIGVMLWPQSTP